MVSHANKASPANAAKAINSRLSSCIATRSTQLSYIHCQNLELMTRTQSLNW